MDLYNPIIIKLSLGILCLILQINLLGKGNLAPYHRFRSSSKLCSGRHYWWRHL